MIFWERSKKNFWKNEERGSAGEEFFRFLVPRSSFFPSDFMKSDLRGLSPIFGVVDLEVREEGGRLRLEETNQRHGAAANLQLGALTSAELQHRPPRSRISRHDDFRLGRIR